MNTYTEIRNNRSPFHPGVMRAFVVLIAGLIVAGSAIAGSKPADTDLQIQTTTGQLLDEQQAEFYGKVLEPDEQNLIYIAADKSGNKTPTIQRMVMTTLAVRALGQDHAFDTGNINISGFSGGGRAATQHTYRGSGYGAQSPGRNIPDPGTGVLARSGLVVEALSKGYNICTVPKAGYL